MPKTNGVGWSNATPYKQKIFREIIYKHLLVVNFIFNKNDWMPRKYVYIDATAGTGFYEGIKGSPLIFLDTLNEINLCFKPEVYFIENRKKAIRELTENVKQYPVTILKGNYQDVIPSIIEKSKEYFGLIYLDPNGIVDFDCIAQISQHIKRIDLFFNYNATAYKRKKQAFGIEEDFIALLNKIKKRFWHIREPISHSQWSFLFGCNSDKFKLTKSLDFYDINSEKGKEILWKLNYTKEEYPSKIPCQTKLP